VTKILITTSAGRAMSAWEHQLGNIAILISTIKTLRELIPDAKISTTLQLSESFCKRQGIKSPHDEVFWEGGYIRTLASLMDLLRCSLWAFLRRFLRLDIGILVRGKRLREYALTDVVLDLAGDSYSSDSVDWIHLLRCSAELLSARLLGKPVICLAVSPGPFYPRLILLLARFTLNRATLITTREQLSNEYLQEIGVKKELLVTTACPAFLFEPAPQERAKEILLHEGVDESDRPLVGVTLAGYNLYSYHTWGIPPTFKDLSSYVPAVKYLLDELKVNVVLIPHVYRTNQWTGEFIHGPDYVILQHLYQLVGGDKYSGRLKLMDGMYSASEIKSVIGQLDLFVTGRLHAGIAALSQTVPTVLLAYGRKHYGVAKLLSQERYVCTGRDPEETISAVRTAWENREEIRKSLQVRLVRVKELANLSFEIVKEIASLDEEEKNHIPKETSDGWTRRGELAQS